MNGLFIPHEYKSFVLILAGTPLLSCNFFLLKVNEQITISTVTGSIGKTELSQIVNNIMAQVKATMETSMGMIHPESRFVQCLNERDTRLKAELDERDKQMRNYIAQMLQDEKLQTQQILTEVDTDEKGVSTEIKDTMKQAMATMDAAHKAINFDQYLETGETDTKEGATLTPRTKALKEQCAATPLKQSWEEALEAGGTTEKQPSDGNEPNSKGDNLNEETASNSANESMNKSLSEVDASAEEAVNGDASHELHDGETEIQPADTSSQQNENHEDNAQENPPPPSNASHNYSEGLPGEDVSSTASEEQLGLDTASITQNAKIKASKRRSERIGAKLPLNKKTTEKDAT